MLEISLFYKTTKKKMKAITYTRYGKPEVLKLNNIEKPEPKDNEVLIKIKATAINSGDVRLRKADPFAVRFFFGLTKPKINILGVVFSGEVEQIGKDVKRFNIGDQVFGSTDMSLGTYAEYKCLKENAPFTLKPGNMMHTEAAVIPFGATTALHFMKKVNIKQGDKVLIYGASGAVGSAAVQLAKYYGAYVTAVCSKANFELVRSIGADVVIDYTKEDFTKNNKYYDVIMDTVNVLSVRKVLKCLNKNGSLILSAAMMLEMLQGAWASMIGSHKVIFGVALATIEDMIFLKELIEANKLKAVIDKTYSLEQIPEAHAYAEKGHKKGNLAIAIF